MWSVSAGRRQLSGSTAVVLIAAGAQIPNVACITRCCCFGEGGQFDSVGLKYQADNSIYFSNSEINFTLFIWTVLHLHFNSNYGHYMLSFFSCSSNGSISPPTCLSPEPPMTPGEFNMLSQDLCLDLDSVSFQGMHFQIRTNLCSSFPEKIF